MASYHCSVKTGGKGRAGKHSDYITREGKYAPELTKGSGSKLEDLEHTASGNMPAWAEHDAGVFWQAADEHERANGATYREIEVALPRELTPDQRRELVEDFIQKQIGDRHPFTYAIHIPKAAIEKGEQPHAHIMYSERTLDGIARDPDQFFKRANSKNPERGGCKKDSAGTKERLLATRELWADVQNKHLEKAGVDARVSHLSLKAQGIDRTPEIHLGPVLARQHAPALREHRAAERELAQTPRVDAAAELAAQAQAQQAAQQAQREAAAAHQAAEQARAQAIAAAELARAAAAVQAEREAEAAKVQAEAEAAAAAHQAAEQARAAAQAQTAREALNAQLTAEKEEKENDRVRETALAALAKSSRATGRSITFAVADHSAIDAAIESSRGHINQSIRTANDRQPNIGAAVAGAERRVFRENINRSAPAVKQQLGTVNRVVQQAVEFFPAVVRAIAAAAKEVTQQLQKAAAKASERPTAAAPVQAKAIPTPAPVLVDTSAFDKTGLRRSDDLDLVKRAKELFAQPKPDGYARYMLSQDLSKAMSAAVREINATEPQASAVDAERTIKTEQNTAARSAGQPEPWRAEQTACAWDTIAFRLDRERKEHLETKRPSGMFSGAAGKEYDAKTAGFTSQIDNITRAAVTLKAELQAKLAEKAQEAAQRGPQHAAAKERHECLTRLHKAVGEAVKQIEANEPQIDHGHGHGSGSGNDFGR
jgi:hypothetical protein